MTVGIWVIGYGSLIFKPPPYTEFRVEGYIKGYVRRFWQSSSDHRGTPESPGRVVTLISLQDLQDNSRFHNDLQTYQFNTSQDRKVDELTPDDLKVWGCAYYVAPENADKVRQYLDVREQDGYTLHNVPFHITSKLPDHDSSLPVTSKSDTFLESSIYIGTIDNESFIGPEDIERTAYVIGNSVGPSGPNSEYLFKLCDSVRQLGPENEVRDFYLEELSKRVKQLK
ncbi:glutathione-specific gamma-glutamylcyclotransferase [[Candida] anglica]|uniref:glutathione-specific gamma-glutamylcyclotransferase n=1 Tax=[Candida] anglica TaxID=148631 RepID=A0ABP0EC01_9ASCO